MCNNSVSKFQLVVEHHRDEKVAKKPAAETVDKQFLLSFVD
jgi:hypothetical protein